MPFIVGVFDFHTDKDVAAELVEQAGIDTGLDGEIEFNLKNAGDDYRGVQMAADPARKDIFVEVDYFDCSQPGGDCTAGDTTSHRPRDDALDIVVQAFNNAPVKEGNGINLWVDVDEALPYRQDPATSTMAASTR